MDLDNASTLTKWLKKLVKLNSIRACLRFTIMQVCLLKLKVHEEKRKESRVLLTKYQPLDNINMNPNIKFETVSVHTGGMVWM